MTETTDHHAHKAASILLQATTLEAVAQCPDCGGRISELTNGAYICKCEGHVFYTRHDLYGDIRWWHGRAPKILGIVIVAIYVLARKLTEKKRSER